jgi:hypothetical protein
MNGRSAADDVIRNQEYEHPRSLRADISRIVSCAVAWFREWILRKGLFTLGVLIPLVIIYGPAFKTHIECSMNPLIFIDDAKQLIFPLFRYHDKELFPHDYFANYYCVSLPIGFRALYKLGATFWDPVTISKILPYILLAATVIGVAAAARQLAGYFGALLAGALVLSGGIFLFTMVGGLPRSFGFPSLALAGAALVYGKPQLLAAIVCASAAFYPPVAIEAGIALALWLFVLPKPDRGDAADWRFSRRLGLVVIVASISALILLPELLGTRAYGRFLGPKDVTEYPERADRYQLGLDGPPFKTFLEATLEEEPRALLWLTGEPWSKKVREWARGRAYHGANSNGDVVIELLTALLLVGGMLASVRYPATRRFLLIGAAAWLSHLLARALAPSLYSPERYIRYAIPILLVVLFPATGAAIGSQLCGRRFSALGQAAGVIAIAAIILLPFGGRPGKDFGMNVDVTSQQSFYGFLQRLPKDALIAGWPTDLDNVPYVSRRQAFITLKLSHSLQKDYADEMRRRMRALIDAYFATDPGPLERLRNDFGVTHLVFRQSILEKPPEYFEPFTDWIQKAFNDGKSKAFELPRQVDRAKVFSDGPLIVLDLRRLNAL